MKIPVNLSIDEDVWREFQEHLKKATPFNPSQLIELVMRSVVSPDAGKIETILDSIFDWVNKKESEIKKSKRRIKNP